VAQGLVMVERDGTVSRERSAAIDKWIGAPAEGAKFAEHLSPVAPMAADLFALGLEELLEGVMPPELTLDQMPKRFTSDGSTYELEYTPITGGDGEIEKLLVVVSDVTAACEKEKAETERRELAHLVDRLMRDRRGLVEFIEESALHVEIVEAATSDSELVKRALHTLKGNSALFGFHSLAGICHDIETHIVEMRAAPTQTHRDRLSERFTRLRTQLDGFLGADSGSLDVAAAEYEALRRAVADRAPHAQLAQTLASWKLEPTARRLGRIAEQVESLAGRLGKGPVMVAIDDGGVRLDAGQWRSFWSSFVHVMKNAVDHGLEAPEERVAAGKPAAGSVTLRTRLEASSLLVEIADDGRGIDWDAVAVKATELGLPHGDPDQLVEALFANGVSTKDSANEISGRGIGMGAIRAECQARGGAVELETRSSGGTRVTCRFPMQSARPTLDQTAA
jgi:two-component system, chemotaxis family, sensor kinase CheA